MLRAIVAILYTLIAERPACYFRMGPRYCPSPPAGKNFSDLYMSSMQRAHLTLLNAVRSNPAEFRQKYGVKYGCQASILPPLAHDDMLQQAAVQQSFMLSLPECPFQHDTCPSFCALYTSCNWWDRIDQYQPVATATAENIAMAGAHSPLKILSLWLASPGHCANIFGPSNTHVGIGNTGRYWAQNFARLSSPAPKVFMISGGHYTPSSTIITFIVSVYRATTPPRLELNGKNHSMVLYIGKTANGAYAINMTSPSACQSYAFFLGNERLPSRGYYLTDGIGSCTRNYRQS